MKTLRSCALTFCFHGNHQQQKCTRVKTASARSSHIPCESYLSSEFGILNVHDGWIPIENFKKVHFPPAFDVYRSTLPLVLDVVLVQRCVDILHLPGDFAYGFIAFRDYLSLIPPGAKYIYINSERPGYQSTANSRERCSDIQRALFHSVRSSFPKAVVGARQGDPQASFVQVNMAITIIDFVILFFSQTNNAVVFCQSCCQPSFDICTFSSNGHQRESVYASEHFDTARSRWAIDGAILELHGRNGCDELRRPNGKPE